jgi:hypothetical protein
MKKPLIPFGWLPGHWGLKGSTRDIAQAEYELDGYDLETRLAELKTENAQDLLLKKLDIDLKYKKITEEEHQRATVEVTVKDEKEKTLKHLENDFKNKKITSDQYERKKADILGEPWASMPKIHWDPLGKGKTYFELDYNQHFVEHLKSHGYDGDEDDIINAWLNDICQSISAEISGVDNQGYYFNPPRDQL